MVDDLIDSYALSCQIRPATIEHYRTCCRDFERWLRRSATPTDWCRDTVNRYLKAREDRAPREDGRRSYSPFTLHNHRVAILVLWRFGYEENIIPEAPPIGRKIRRVRKPPLTMHVVKPDDIRELLRRMQRLTQFIKNGRAPTCVYWGAWVRVAWDSGLRLMDQARLPYQPLIDGGGVYRLIQQKTNHPVTIRLSPSTLAALQQLHAYVPFEVLAFPDWYKGHREISHRFKEITQQLGMTLNLTVIRKSSGTNVEIMKPGSAWRHLGHKSRATADEWYLNAEHTFEGIPRPTEIGAIDLEEGGAV